MGEHSAWGRANLVGRRRPRALTQELTRGVRQAEPMRRPLATSPYLAVVRLTAIVVTFPACDSCEGGTGALIGIAAMMFVGYLVETASKAAKAAHGVPPQQEPRPQSWSSTLRSSESQTHASVGEGAVSPEDRTPNAPEVDDSLPPSLAHAGHLLRRALTVRDRLRAEADAHAVALSETDLPAFDAESAFRRNVASELDEAAVSLEAALGRVRGSVATSVDDAARAGQLTATLEALLSRLPGGHQ